MSNEIHYHCILSSDPHEDEESSNINLQLFFLKQALCEFKSLKRALLTNSSLNCERERCVLVVTLLWTSVCQLLGQNDPDPCTDKVASPKTLFQKFLQYNTSKFTDIRLPPITQETFDSQIDFYDKCRHYGFTTLGTSYNVIEQIDFEKTEELVKCGLSIWEMVLSDNTDDESLKEWQKLYIDGYFTKLDKS